MEPSHLILQVFLHCFIFFPVDPPQFPFVPFFSMQSPLLCPYLPRLLGYLLKSNLDCSCVFKLDFSGGVGEHFKPISVSAAVTGMIRIGWCQME